MILLEYEAKRLLQPYDIPMVKGELYYDGYKPDKFPVVVKSQVPTGGRGKLGGVKIATNQTELDKYATQIKQTEIKGFLPTNIYIEPAIDIKQEYYLSLMLNRDLECLQFTAHKNGGIEIESEPAASFLNITLPHSKPDFDVIGEQLAEYYGLEGHTFALQDLAENLYKAFIKNDALLIEINPLILSTAGKLYAGDAKIELDSSAFFRHQWSYETPLPNANFVVLNPTGNIATIANGAGLAMATVDAISDAGLEPANFLDIGGGANEAKVLEAFNTLMEFPNTKAIIINIFGGITQCDQIATAIVGAQAHIPNLPPLFIRLSGTGYKEAKAILDQHNIPLLPNLEECVTLAKQEVENEK